MESGAYNQERILEAPLVQNGGLLKHRDRTHGQKELLHQGCEGWLLCTMGLGEIRKKGG